MNLHDTGFCPTCGGIRPEHTLEEWRDCKRPPRITFGSWHYHDYSCLREREDGSVYCVLEQPDAPFKLFGGMRG